MSFITRVSLPFVLSLPLLTFATPAQAAVDFRIDGTVDVRPVSGISGTKNSTVLRDEVGIVGIGLWENTSNKPCFSKFFVRDLGSTSSGGTPYPKEVGDSNLTTMVWAMGHTCSDNVPASNPSATLVTTSKLKDYKTASLGSGYWVSAIQVCTNNASESSKKRVAGIRLFGSQINPTTGVVTRAHAVTAEYSLSSCKDWENKSTCDADMVASGLDYHVANSDEGLSGIALRCHKVKKVLARPAGQ